MLEGGITSCLLAAIARWQYQIRIRLYGRLIMGQTVRNRLSHASGAWGRAVKRLLFSQMVVGFLNSCLYLTSQLNVLQN